MRTFHHLATWFATVAAAATTAVAVTAAPAAAGPFDGPDQPISCISLCLRWPLPGWR